MDPLGPPGWTSGELKGRLDSLMSHEYIDFSSHNHGSVENGSLQYYKFPFHLGDIVHFHDYGRKAILSYFVHQLINTHMSNLHVFSRHEIQHTLPIQLPLL